MANWPSTADALITPTSTTSLSSTSARHSNQHGLLSAVAMGVAAKLGYSSSTSGAGIVSPTTSTGQVLRVSDTSGRTSWGTVPTAGIAANAVTQLGEALGVTSSPSITSTSFVDMTDMSVSMTGVTVGSIIEVIFVTPTQETGGNLVTLAVKMDSGTDDAQQISVPGVAGNVPCVTVVKHYVATSTSHTFKGRWKTGGGTAVSVGTGRSLHTREYKR